jgi:hypothetical protein
LYSQRIAQVKFTHPGEVVAWFGAMQAQDFASVRWAVGLRCEKANDDDIEKAIAEHNILRTWLLRGTLHLVSPRDIHWMLRLLGPRLISGSARRNRQLELDEATFSNSFQILTKALLGGRAGTRSEIMEALNAAGISTAGQRGYHILGRAALEGLICFGPRHGKQQTFVLLDEWATPARPLECDEALAELALRYFASHGPATLADFAWWSGLASAEARQALELARTQLDQQTLNGRTYWLHHNPPEIMYKPAGAYLLPAFDEYFLGYTDRSAILDPHLNPQLVSSNGVFRPMLVIDGQVLGIWKQELSKHSIKITLKPFKPLNRTEEQAIVSAAEQYGAFLGFSVTLD